MPPPDDIPLNKAATVERSIGPTPAPGGRSSSPGARQTDSPRGVDAVRPVVQRVLDGYPGVEFAVLFGSVARSGTRARDVDLGVWLTSGDTSELVAIDTALGRALRCPVDVIVLNTAPPLLRFEIARDGVVLIERRPGAWSDFRARAMIDWWDWAPTARRLWSVTARRLREQVQRDATVPGALPTDTQETRTRRLGH